MRAHVALKALVSAACGLLLAGCGAGEKSGNAADPVADTIYVGGNIITINDAAPFAEALAVKDWKNSRRRRRRPTCSRRRATRRRLVDLGGKTLIPGFVDGHSHIGAVGSSGCVRRFVAAA